MRVISEVEEWRSFADAQRAAGRHVGLVPTMGALHAGHTSLIEVAKSRGDVVIATSFVNPRQFEDQSDLARYPRTPEVDRTAAESHGVDCFVEPTLTAMWPVYPDPTPTTVRVRALSDVLEGAARPGHFDGVASVVAKLLIVTGPCRVYFGEKDFQQLAVIRQMVHDLDVKREVVHHLADHGQLLEVLLAEVDPTRSGHNQQLRDDARHAVEMSGSSGALEDVAQSTHPDRRGSRIGIDGPHRGERGLDKAVDAVAFGGGTVDLGRAGITREITLIFKLTGIHERRRDDDVTTTLGDLDERRVPGVQCAHRRHEADVATRGALRVGEGTPLLYFTDHAH